MCNTASKTGLILALIIVGSECVRQKRQDLIPSPRVGKRLVLRDGGRGDVGMLLKGLTDTGDTRSEMPREGEEDWSHFTGQGRERRHNAGREWFQQPAATRRPHPPRTEQTILIPAHLQALFTLYNSLQRMEDFTADSEESNSRSKLAV